MSDSNKLFTSSWEGYELLDAGGGKKLESFGGITTIRPELQAYFKSGISFEKWGQQASCIFTEQSTTKGTWKKDVSWNEDEWYVTFRSLRFKLGLTTFKHIGIFPEQAENWSYIADHLHANDNFLNLFAYTGIASIVARNNHANVTHVDSVKHLIQWAKDNMTLNTLNDIRWIQEDALVFAQKEVKRGKKYDMILMDPPAFGFGAKGEKWILEQKLPALLQAAYDLLSPNGTLILNTYSPKLDLTTLIHSTAKVFERKRIIGKELWAKTTTGKELFYGNLVRVKKGFF